MDDPSLAQTLMRMFFQTNGGGIQPLLPLPQMQNAQELKHECEKKKFPLNQDTENSAGLVLLRVSNFLVPSLEELIESLLL